MANKYIRHGETYNGDGTSSAAASSNGGVGAWNNINILAGTAPSYGTLAAGDTVYIRSKTSAGADITVTLAGNTTLGLASATESSPVDWVLDNGDIWAGISGTLTYENAAGTAYTITLNNFNNIINAVQDAFVLRSLKLDPTSPFAYFGAAIYERFLIDQSAKTGTNGSGIVVGATTLISPHVKYGYIGGTCVFMSQSYGGGGDFIDPHIELLNNGGVYPVFMPSYNNYPGRMILHGGKITGVGTTTGRPVGVIDTSNGLAILEVYGTDIPKTMTLCKAPASTTPMGCSVTAFGLDKGAGAAVEETWGAVDSRDDGNYPVLNATLPDSSATGWSWYVRPTLASLKKPAKLKFGKLFTDTAAAKTLTVELLVSDTFTGYNSRSVFVHVSYIDDTTGAVVGVVTRANAASALSISTAAWSATTYGSINLLKKKIAITTPSAIKKDTMVLVTLFWGAPVILSTDCFFVCPDVQMS